MTDPADLVAGAADSGPELASGPELEPESAGPAPRLTAQQLDALGQHLVWRMGRDDLTDEVVVRVGYASAAGQFAALSRLRNVPDAELEQALISGQLRLEWVE